MNIYVCANVLTNSPNFEGILWHTQPMVSVQIKPPTSSQGPFNQGRAWTQIVGLTIHHNIIYCLLWAKVPLTWGLHIDVMEKVPDH